MPLRRRRARLQGRGGDGASRGSADQPREPAVASNLANALLAKGDEAGALQALRDGISKNRSNAGLTARLAFLLATARDPRIRNGREAHGLARRAVEATARKDPHALDALAAALAETGRVTDAASIADEAGRLAAAAGEKDLEAAIAERRRGYLAGRPWRGAGSED